MTKLAKAILTLAAAMALCTLAMPSPASAASWTVVGTEHTLDSPNLGFTGTTGFGALVAQCTSSSLTGTVASGANLAITAATFGRNCTANFAGGNICTMTLAATRFPWTMTAVTTSTVSLEGFTAFMVTEQSPANNCFPFFNGTFWTITGSVSGTWNATEEGGGLQQRGGHLVGRGHPRHRPGHYERHFPRHSADAGSR